MAGCTDVTQRGDVLPVHHVPDPDRAVVEAQRLLGGDGHDAHLRLGLAPTTKSDEIRSTAISTIERWRTVAEDPLLNKDARDVATGVIRSCEALATTA